MGHSYCCKIEAAAAATNSKHIKNIADLKGKTFGITKVDRGSHINTLLETKRQGWSEENGDFIIKPLGNLNSIITALKNGDIDCFVWEPLSIKSLLDKGDLKIISDVIPTWPSFMIASRITFLKEYSNTEKMVMSALPEAAKIFHNDKRRAIQIMSKRYNLSEQDFELWLDKVQYSIDGAISLDSLKQTTNILLKVGSITKLVEPSDIVDQII